MARKTTKQQTAKNPSRSRGREIAGILLIVFSLVLTASLISHDPADWPNSSRTFDQPTYNWIGQFGAVLSLYILRAIGFTAYALALFMLVAGGVLFMHRNMRLLVAPACFAGVAGIFLPILVALILDVGSGNTRVEPAFTLGGMLGEFTAYYMVTYLGRIGAFLLSLAALLVTIVLTTNIRLSVIVEFLARASRPFIDMLLGVFHGSENEEEEPVPDSRDKKRVRFDSPLSVMSGDENPFLTPLEDVDEMVPVKEEPVTEPTIRIPTAQTETGEYAESVEKSEEEAAYEELDEQLDTVPEEYQLPGVELLDPPEQEGPAESREEMLEQARRIVESLKHFNIDAEVRNITPGPIVTRYEITLAPGIKVGRVVGLANDLSMALRAKGGIRILAPIPGKAAIGIEVPNRTRTIVYIREIAESIPFRDADRPLAMAIGKSTAGDPVVADLSKMPHLLIAGSTGSGKSVCINTIIASILMKATPREVRMIMVDPKVVELNIYNSIPHLLTPVITNPGRAASALKWAVREMETRYRRLASLGVRDIDQYNTRVDDIRTRAEEAAAVAATSDEEPDDIADDVPVAPATVLPERLPLIVIIIDEFADLMVLAAREIEESIARLAQMARAVGMHLILATQRPSADVITGLIKANFPSRIAFKVMQASNSRIILDESGADKLLGMGDMLFLQAGKPESVRLHGAYISNEECSRIVRFIGEHSNVTTDLISEDEFADEPEIGDNTLGLRDPNDRDALFFEAARLVVRHNQGSVSLLQRRLKVGYARAARLIDQLELAGIVSPYDGSKAREVLVDDEYIDELEAGDY